MNATSRFAAIAFACVAVRASLGATHVAFAAPPAPAPSEAFLDVPLGVAIAVRTTERLSSQDAAAGQRFGFQTTRDVRVGTLEVPAGTRGRGHVAAAESGRGAHAGRLSLSADEIDLSDGSRFPVAMKLGGGPSSDTPSTGARLPIPLLVDGSLVLVGRNGGPQNNVVFEKGTQFTVVTAPSSTPLPLPT